MVLMMAVAVVTMASFAPAVELTEPADIPAPVVEAVPLVAPDLPEYVKSVYGVGYKFEV